MHKAAFKTHEGDRDSGPKNNLNLGDNSDIRKERAVRVVALRDKSMEMPEGADG
jgi:hypothetical protein